MAIAEIKTGYLATSDGAVNTARSDKSNALVTVDGHGRYQESVYRGNVFTASLQSSTAVTNLATTATGLILSNPAGSGKNLVLLELLLAQTSTAAASANAAIVLAANVNPNAAATVHTTSLTVRNALLGSSIGSVGFADSAATLPVAPVVVRTIWQPSVSATATTAIPPFIKDEIAGALLVAPGCTVSLSAFGAISVIATITWEEIPV